MRDRLADWSTAASDFYFNVGKDAQQGSETVRAAGKVVLDAEEALGAAVRRDLGIEPP